MRIGGYDGPVPVPQVPATRLDHYYVVTVHHNDQLIIADRGEWLATADVGKAVEMVLSKFHPDVRDELRISIEHRSMLCFNC